MNKDKGPKFKLVVQNIQSGSQMGKGINYVPEPSPVAGSISVGKGRKACRSTKGGLLVPFVNHIMLAHR
jgi:hypothetical protein